jgi:hypothetical protein
MLAMSTPRSRRFCPVAVATCGGGIGDVVAAELHSNGRAETRLLQQFGGVLADRGCR